MKIIFNEVFPTRNLGLFAKHFFPEYTPSLMISLSEKTVRESNITCVFEGVYMRDFFTYIFLVTTFSSLYTNNYVCMYLSISNN